MRGRSANAVRHEVSKEGSAGREGRAAPGAGRGRTSREHALPPSSSRGFGVHCFGLCWTLPAAKLGLSHSFPPAMGFCASMPAAKLVLPRLARWPADSAKGRPLGDLNLTIKRGHWPSDQYDPKSSSKVINLPALIGRHPRNSNEAENH